MSVPPRAAAHGGIQGILARECSARYPESDTGQRLWSGRSGWEIRLLSGKNVYFGVFQIRPAANEASGKDLLAIIAEELKRHNPRRVEQDEETIVFRGGFFTLGSSWNLLAPITSGTIVFRESESCLKYSLSYLELIVSGTCATIFLSMVTLANGEPKERLMITAIEVWGILVGVNLLLSLFRFHSFMEKCISKSSFKVVE